MKQCIWIVLLLLYAAGIGALSHQSMGTGGQVFPYADKLFHLLEFGGFMFLAWHATGRRLLLAWMLAAAYAAVDEWHQSFVPTRDASLLDVAADLLGAAIMAAILKSRVLLWRFFSARILGR